MVLNKLFALFKQVKSLVQVRVQCGSEYLMPKQWIYVINEKIVTPCLILKQLGRVLNIITLHPITRKHWDSRVSIYMNTALRVVSIIFNSITIELTMHTSCYCLELIYVILVPS